MRKGEVCAIKVERREDSWDAWEGGWYPELFGLAMKSKVSTASASIAAFWLGVRCEGEGLTAGDRPWNIGEAVIPDSASPSFGVGRLLAPGFMSAGGARERELYGFLESIGALGPGGFGTWPCASERLLSELELSLHLRCNRGLTRLCGEAKAARSCRCWKPDTVDRGEADAMDSSSSSERACQPFWTLSIAYFNFVRS